MSLGMATQTHGQASSMSARRAFETTDPRVIRLREIVENESLLRGEFKLSSGPSSKYFVRINQTTLHPEGSFLIGDMVINFMQRERIRCVGGREVGAIPVASAATVVGVQKGYPISAFFVRKKPKSHGAMQLVDGHIRDGEEILFVDDVTTTGNSILQAVDAVADRGTVTKALAVVDREEGAAENLAARGIQLYYLLKRSDFKID